ncbi:hypothetical protein FB639_006128, partial [Coemansia asiatica]
MDIATSEGRREFIRLLAYWSFAEDHRLGYDPTMRRLEELSCWEIEVPTCSDDSHSNKCKSPPKLYYSNLITIAAERMFGRHSRGFLATPVKPTENEQIELGEYSVFIKDAWPEAHEDSSKDACDEIRHLAKIKRILGEKREELKDMYPTIEAGGRVHIKHEGSAEETQDTTRAILGDILEQTKAAEKKKTETDGGISKEETVVHVRVHKRIATTPIGLPISKAKSVPELLIIVADVMRCHHAIYEECRILHRDVSINNIMFCRTPGGGVAGLLIDFDHAMDEEHENDKPHDMRTGTMPYMSINNLENSSTKRT